MKKNSLKSSFLLLMAAVIWGMAFVAQSVGMDYLGPYSFTSGRFLMGSMVLLPLILIRRQKKQKDIGSSSEWRTTIWGGICCGAALCAGTLFQQKGLLYTSVGKAGFITTLYIIIVPVLGIFLKKKISGKVWIGVVVAAVGMYMLCMSESLRLSKGDTLIFICAFIFSLHILAVNFFAPKVDGVELSCIQFLVAAIISGVAALVLEKPVLTDFVAGIIPLAYAGILSSGVAYTLQILGQKNVEPAVASLLLSLESVFAALAGWAILRQSLRLRELIGCGLVFAAVILVQLPDNKQDSKQDNSKQDNSKQDNSKQDNSKQDKI